MIVFSIILVLLTFFEATLLPLQLTILIIALRSLIKEDKVNLYLAFSFGLLISFLNKQPLGINSALYLLIVLAIYFLKKTNISNQFLIIFPLSFFVIALSQMVNNFQNNLSLGLDLNALLVQIILTLPIYIAIRFWEERFVPDRDIKLKIRS